MLCKDSRRPICPIRLKNGAFIYSNCSLSFLVCWACVLCAMCSSPANLGQLARTRNAAMARGNSTRETESNGNKNRKRSGIRSSHAKHAFYATLAAGGWLLAAAANTTIQIIICAFVVRRYILLLHCHSLPLFILIHLAVAAVIGRERMSCPSQSIHGIRDKRVSEYTTRMPSDGRCCVHSHHMDEKRKGRRLDKKHADIILTGFSTLNASRDIHRNTEYFPKNGNFWSFWPSAQYIHLKDRKKHIRMKSNSSSFRRKQTGNPQNRKCKNKHGFC